MATRRQRTAAIALMEALCTQGVHLVEWEANLFIRLGCPFEFDDERTWPGVSLFLLIPDAQLPLVHATAALFGLAPADEAALPRRHPCEWSPLAVRFPLLDPDPPKPRPRARRPPQWRPQWRPRRLRGSSPAPDVAPTSIRPRLVVAPFSWAGIAPSDACRMRPELPRAGVLSILNFPYWAMDTVPLSVAYTALTRIAVRPESPVLEATVESMARLILHGLLGMEYKPLWGKYDRDKVERAVEVVEGWEMREGEEWIRESLVKLLRELTQSAAEEHAAAAAAA